METIRQYMESLFAGFPNTPEVMRAKDRLLEMSEDKYLNLREEGISDNEAVAKVIAEFGNLDELKEELGITEEVEKKAEADTKEQTPPTLITINDAKQMISDHLIAAILCGWGVAFFICCPVPAILMENGIGAALMFVFIAGGVALMIIKSSYISRWKHIRKQRCVVDYSTAEYVKSEYKRTRTVHTVLMAVGVVLCVACLSPVIIFNPPFVSGGLEYVGGYIAENLGPALMFLMVAAGVALMVAARGSQKAYKKLLSVNPTDTVGGTYSKGSGRLVFENKMLGAFMNIYWPLVTCLYFTLSFITFQWWITWIIWPVAAVARVFIDNAFGERE